MVLASTRDNTPIKKLAQLADKVMEFAIPTISKVPVQPSLNNLEMLQGEIASLKQDIKTLQQAAHNQVPCCRSPSPYHNSSSPVIDHSPIVCWYHQKFGTLVKKCRLLCSYLGNNSASHWWWPVSLAITLVTFFNVTDCTSGLCSLVDTGAVVNFSFWP